MKQRKWTFVVLAILVVSVVLTVLFSTRSRHGGKWIIHRNDPNGMCDYVLRLPQNKTSNERVPLLLWIHGAGQADEVAGLIKSTPWAYAKENIPPGEFPFAVAAPFLCPVGKLDDFVKQLLKRYPQLDPSRVYLSGISVGGLTVLQAAANRPDRYAAVAPLAGNYMPGGNTSDGILLRLKDVPLWFFHGEQDKSVPKEQAIAFAKQLQAAGNLDVHMTIVPQAGHNIGPQVYSNPALYQWFLEHKKKN